MEECVEKTEGWYERRVWYGLDSRVGELLTCAFGGCRGTVGGSLRDFLSDALRGEGPSGMTGNVNAISACMTCAGFALFWSFTVAVLAGALACPSSAATGSRHGGESATEGSGAKLTVAFFLERLVTSFCCSREARDLEVGVVGRVDSLSLTPGIDKGDGIRISGNTYGRPSDIGSSIDVSSLTAAAVLP